MRLLLLCTICPRLHRTVRRQNRRKDLLHSVGGHGWDSERRWRRDGAQRGAMVGSRLPGVHELCTGGAVIFEEAGGEGRATMAGAGAGVQRLFGEDEVVSVARQSHGQTVPRLPSSLLTALRFCWSAGALQRFTLHLSASSPSTPLSRTHTTEAARLPGLYTQICDNDWTRR